MSQLKISFDSGIEDQPPLIRFAEPIVTYFVSPPICCRRTSASQLCLGSSSQSPQQAADQFLFSTRLSSHLIFFRIIKSDLKEYLQRQGIGLIAIVRLSLSAGSQRCDGTKSPWLYRWWGLCLGWSFLLAMVCLKNFLYPSFNVLFGSLFIIFANGL